MKYSLLLLTLLYLLMACDSPMRTRFQPTTEGNGTIDGYTDGTGGDGGNGGDGGDGGDGGNGGDEGNGQTTPGFENCTLGMQYYGGPNIGYFGICQSSDNETVFKAKKATADPTPELRTCYVPIHIIGESSFKLGLAWCQMHSANTEYDFTLTKERPEAINGVMVIKDGPALFGYMQCMNAKVHYLQGFPAGSVPDTQCIAQASGNPDAYAFCVCTKFKGMYSTYYKQIALPIQN